MKILVTGGAGFIGSNFIHYIVHEYPDWELTNLDSLTYAGNLENLKDLEKYSNYRFVMGDISDDHLIYELLGNGFDCIINFAAESHVDRSILDSAPFIQTNVKGVQTLLEGARKYKIGRFLQVSTDEVYGSIAKGKFTEKSMIAPNSPYSASKAAADMLCLAYFETYNTPVIITRCTNNYGPYQFPEKLIPLAITNIMENRPVPVYGDGLNIRDWISVDDHCRALLTVMLKGMAGEVYNIGGGNEKTNLYIVKTLLKLMDKSENLIKFVADRPGHDRRYALDISKIKRDLGWKPVHKFEKYLQSTVNWYKDNHTWWQRIKSGEYRKYYELMYGK